MCHRHVVHHTVTSFLLIFTCINTVNSSITTKVTPTPTSSHTTINNQTIQTTTTRQISTTATTLLTTSMITTVQPQHETTTIPKIKKVKEKTHFHNCPPNSVKFDCQCFVSQNIVIDFKTKIKSLLRESRSALRVYELNRKKYLRAMTERKLYIRTARNCQENMETARNSEEILRRARETKKNILRNCHRKKSAANRHWLRYLRLLKRNLRNEATEKFLEKQKQEFTKKMKASTGFTDVDCLKTQVELDKNMLENQCNLSTVKRQKVRIQMQLKEVKNYAMKVKKAVNKHCSDVLLKSYDIAVKADSLDIRKLSTARLKNEECFDKQLQKDSQVVHGLRTVREKVEDLRRIYVQKSMHLWRVYLSLCRLGEAHADCQLEYNDKIDNLHQLLMKQKVKLIDDLEKTVTKEVQSTDKTASTHVKSAKAKKEAKKVKTKLKHEQTTTDSQEVKKSKT